MNNLEVTRTSLPPFEEYCQEIKSLWDSRFITNMGEKHQELQERLEDFFGCPVVLFSSGHMALEAALSVLGLTPGTEVITTPLTFVSTVNALVRRGLVPVFADVLPADGCLDPSCVERLITEQTGAILPVHVYGNVCDTEAFAALSQRYGIPVLYDAAHCFGVRYQGVPVPSLGALSIVSFHATKVFTTIEGGAVCFHDPALRQRLDDEKNFGIRDKEVCVSAGGNAKLNEFQAAMGLCNLRHFAGEQALRHQVYQWYTEALGLPSGPAESGCHSEPACHSERSEESLSILRPRAGVAPNYAYFPLLFGSQTLRDQTYTALEAAGIHARKYFYPLCSDFPHLAPYRHGSPSGSSSAPTPVAASLASRVLCLPLHPYMSENDVLRVCDIITRFGP